MTLELLAMRESNCFSSSVHHLCIRLIPGIRVSHLQGFQLSTGDDGHENFGSLPWHNRRCPRANTHSRMHGIVTIRHGDPVLGMFFVQ